MKTHYINGAWQKGTGKHFQSTDPFTGKVIWEGYEATPAEVSQAMDAATASFKSWRALSLSERADYLYRFIDILEKKGRELAELISKEMGKPLWESMGEVYGMIPKVTISKEAYQNRTGTHYSEQSGVKTQLMHRPHGVMAIFSPFNFPAHLAHGQIVPALLAGNCILFKPSELTPAVGEWIMTLWEKIGLPKGVLNLLQGGPDTGQAILEQEGVTGIYFTGSYATGSLIHRHFAGRPEVLLALEMGGNNPLIVGSIKNRKVAAYHAIQSAFITSGQRCTCARRLIVPEGLEGDAFLHVLCEMASNLQVGQYAQDPMPFIGPVVHQKASERLLKAQEEWLQKGGKTLLPMRQMEASPNLLTPGIIDMTDVVQRSDEEVFGPLLQVIRVPDFATAVAEANNTRYGLVAGLLSEDRNEFETLFAESKVGLLNWNRPTTGATGWLPFGGLGRSGSHRPSAYYAADYCAYPVASQWMETLELPEKISPGISIEV